MCLTCLDNIESGELDPVQFMRNILEQLAPSEGAGKHGESSILHDFQHASPEMLLEWIHLGESAVIHGAEFMDVDGNEEEDEAEMNQLEKISDLKDLCYTAYTSWVWNWIMSRSSTYPIQGSQCAS